MSWFSKFSYLNCMLSASCRVCYTSMYDIVLLIECVGLRSEYYRIALYEISSKDEEVNVIDEYFTKHFRLQKYTSQTC